MKWWIRFLLYPLFFILVENKKVKTAYINNTPVKHSDAVFSLINILP